MKHIELTRREWNKIREHIKDEYGQSMILISAKMKRELGFTVREHRAYDPFDPMNRQEYRTIICLDFYDEQMKSWFALKYL